ncbi:hypothetical protein [Qiania dongpingensis]|uniref:Mannose-6-phosphate isomerase n=1 Tax=Qiania dongpingensis TaxID=2763669 RepID=A0A7G9G7B6_9FIRM|nr:hypothetical protein [Qiania dongpingensis]QNM06698.1 hypothetical protein H9Q78_06180 [Qiania dongpingensis]
MSKIKEALEKGHGVLQLMPTWVPRPFNEPGRRLKLHPDDYFALGMDRGGICERWIGSVAHADNGPLTKPDEGMSYVVLDKSTGEKALLKEVIEELGAEIIGQELYGKYGTWPSYSKFFDYDKPLFHHLHLMDKDASLIGTNGKPEAYYFPPQYNCSQLGRRPSTYFGFDPSTTKEQVRQCLADYSVRDTHILELSRGYQIQLGTGWYTPAGVIHAPASVVTYEPQWNADCNVIMENVTMGEVNSYDLLTGCQPEEKKGDLDALMDCLDWEECVRPDYKETYFRAPKEKESHQTGLSEKWITYANDWVAAKEVTIAPQSSVVVKDAACYDAIFVQGHGKFGVYNCEAPGLLRYGQFSGDEYFVSESAAKKGIVVTNESEYEPLVFLQHFSNNNPEVPKTVK